MVSKQIGYIRASTQEQEVERQKLNILAACPEAVLIIEHYTGTKMHRPKWDKLMNACESGYVTDIWFDAPDRMGRTADECFKVYKHLWNDLQISLHFIKQPYINTSVYEETMKQAAQNIETLNSGDESTDKLVNTILDAVHIYMLEMAEKQIWYAFREAELEVENISRRTKSGQKAARLRGSTWGTRPGTHYISSYELKARPQIIRYSKVFGGKYGIEDLSRITKIRKNSLKAYIERIMIEQKMMRPEDAKYSDGREFNAQIHDKELYDNEADREWIRRFGKPMIRQPKLPPIQKPESMGMQEYHQTDNCLEDK